jgi:hypothetical protein
MPYRISARMLGKLAMPDFCPRCFWIEMKSDKFPFALPMPGIFSSIDAYGKNVVHSFFDRNASLPSWFPNIGRVVGYVRGLHYSTFNFTDGSTEITLTGVPDDIYEMEDGSYVIVDYKTARLTERQDALLPLYEVQLNAYAYVARHTGLTPITSLFLIYMEPQTGAETWEQSASEEHFSIRFSATPKHVELRSEGYINSLLKETREILGSPSPISHIGCQNCTILQAFMDTVKKSDESKPF